MSRLKHVLQILIWIAVFEMIGFFLGQITQANLNPWYDSLHKSSLTPPGYVFAVTWSLLYAILAFAGWDLFSNARAHNRVLYLFSIQMIMNWCWTIFFFQYHWLLFSAIWLLALTGLTLWMTLILYKTRTWLGYLLTPYVIWLFFASWLNASIVYLN